MKKAILLSFALFFTTVINAQKIDFDYDKLFKADVAYIDFNSDGEVDDDELLAGDISASIRYRDFGTAGNAIRIGVAFKNGDKGMTIGTTYKDINLIKKEDGYYVVNKLNELLFSITKDEKFGNILAIFNIEPYKEVE